MKIGFFGGTFNPVHNGHVEIAQKAISTFSLDRLFFVPSAMTPGKTEKSKASFFHRWEMLKRVVDTIDKSEIISCESGEKDISYTAESIEKVKKSFPEAEIFLILGEDVFASFKKWYRADYILSSAHLVVFGRCDADNQNSLSSDCDFYFPFSETVSSKAVRKSINEGHPISDFVPENVERYIYANALYMTGLDKAAVEYIKARQKTSRFQHTLGVTYTAVHFAAVLNADPTKARCAAYLHDAAKEMPAEQLRDLCDCIKFKFDPQGIIPVLHAPAGAVLADKVFHVEKAVSDAILYHCTLVSSPSLLEKIIYISDMIEPGRHYPSVDELQKIGSNVKNESELDNLIILAIKRNLCYIVNNGFKVHPASEQALSFLEEQYKNI